MHEAENLNPRLAARLRAFADQPLAAFDADRVAAAAIASGTHRPRWMLAAGAAAATAVVLATVVSVGLLSRGNDQAALPPPAPLATTPAPTPSPSPAPTPSIPSPSEPSELSQADAIAIARVAEPRAADWVVLFARVGPSGELLRPASAYDLDPHPPSDRMVWIITLASGPDFGAEGSTFVIDALDGRIYGILRWIS